MARGEWRAMARASRCLSLSLPSPLCLRPLPIPLQPAAPPIPSLQLPLSPVPSPSCPVELPPLAKTLLQEVIGANFLRVASIRQEMTKLERSLRESEAEQQKLLQILKALGLDGEADKF